MESVIVELKNSDEEKAVLSFLDNLKISYKKFGPEIADDALDAAIEEGKKEGRASAGEQREFEQWLNGL